ncbi:MAG: MBL fold metallo-hydrolase [Piscinibacter sp.]|uniref:MBL fold metallo-hydrolase n=1 Tax=Piscinibacter sp. TaxID=1903157 RepID=UPI001B72FA27|nr:MBL fold metallo-hydrolase [Piscinibacter sp.]MBP5992189.1 MBL fold metallo-hydrolase [Piscinibacter sp.]MBP6029249.1 MBL fold metallo-hydrolase [Piscinibacter sp.]
MSSLPSYAQDLGDGIFAIDTGFHRPVFDAAYLMVENGRAAFIDSGTNFAVPRLLATLEALGLAREAVEYVIPTHVHLDHAGGVGLLMQNLPAATAIVHPRGARHMIDPSALVAGATAVYGEEEMARSYGSIVGVPAQRVRESADGMSIDLAGRLLRFLDTPGHARHHHCIWDSRTRGFFTGDTFGLSYREFDTDKGPWLLPTTTPVQFEPDKLRESVQRLLAYQPECMYLTHYSRVRDVQRLGASLLEQLARLVAIGRGLKNAPDRHEALKRALLAEYVAITAAHGCRFSEAELTRLLGVDLELNAQGMGVWLDKET